MTFSLTMPVSFGPSSRNQPVKASKMKIQASSNAPSHVKPFSSGENGAEDVFLKAKPAYPPPSRSRLVPKDTVSVGELLSDRYLVREKKSGKTFLLDLNRSKIVPRFLDSTQGTHYEIANKHVRDKNEKTLFVYNIEEPNGPFEIKLSGKSKDPFSQKEEHYQMTAMFDELSLNGKTDQLELVKPAQDDSLVFDPNRNYWKEAFQEQQKQKAPFSNVES